MEHFCFSSLFNIPAQCLRAKYLPLSNAHLVCYELDKGTDTTDHFLRYFDTCKGELPKFKITFSFFFFFLTYLHIFKPCISDHILIKLTEILLAPTGFCSSGEGSVCKVEMSWYLENWMLVERSHLRQELSNKAGKHCMVPTALAVWSSGRNMTQAAARDATVHLWKENYLSA